MNDKVFSFSREDTELIAAALLRAGKYTGRSDLRQQYIELGNMTEQQLRKGENEKDV